MREREYKRNNEAGSRKRCGRSTLFLFVVFFPFHVSGRGVFVNRQSDTHTPFNREREEEKERAFFTTLYPPSTSAVNNTTVVDSARHNSRLW